MTFLIIVGFIYTVIFVRYANAMNRSEKKDSISKSDEKIIDRYSFICSSLYRRFNSKDVGVSANMMEDRANDFLAKQIREELRSKAAVSEMFDLKMSHMNNCEADYIKHEHHDICEADIVTMEDN